MPALVRSRHDLLSAQAVTPTESSKRLEILSQVRIVVGMPLFRGGTAVTAMQ
jgi:hypothetical protein